MDCEAMAEIWREDRMAFADALELDKLEAAQQHEVEQAEEEQHRKRRAAALPADLVRPSPMGLLLPEEAE